MFSSTGVSGFLDDYAYLIRGLIELHETTQEMKWLRWAERLQERQDTDFWDPQHHAYFTTPQSTENQESDLLIRLKDGQSNTYTIN